MAEAPIMILNIVRDARRFIGEVSSPFAKRESVCVCVCDDVLRTRIHTAPFVHPRGLWDRVKCCGCQRYLQIYTARVRGNIQLLCVS